MPICKGVRELARFDCRGGGQITVDNGIAYIGHMKAPSGTSIVDVRDPMKPRITAEIGIADGLHSHKVQATNGIMLVNREIVSKEKAAANGLRGGLGIYDVSNPASPREINRWECDGTGVHRFTFDGRYAYISPEIDGYIGNIVMILDLIDPAKPTEVGRWWIPGQWKAGGEPYPWDNWVSPRCHHPLRVGDRLYVSYWHHGLFILDIADMTRPKLVSHVNTSPAFPHPTHTCLRMPQKLHGRDILVVADEDVAKLWPAAPSFAWVYDITNEHTPVSIATFQVPGLDTDGSPQPPMTGCHQPSERFHGTVIPFAWFAQGMRLVDVADPFHPTEVGHYLPDPPQGAERASSNDVTVDSRGLIYLVDRVRGVDIIETDVF